MTANKIAAVCYVQRQLRFTSYCLQFSVLLQQCLLEICNRGFILSNRCSFDT
uniref:Uncharacterized protein n=1 Tax=Arundo donax TaxID=35708 RepID=A0A0A9C7V2_ARUDO